MVPSKTKNSIMGFMLSAFLKEKPGSGLCLVGQVSFETIVATYQHGLSVLDRQMSPFTLDLSEVGNGDSSILALLSAWIRYTMEHQKQLTLVQVPLSLRHLMQLSGLDTVFPIENK